MAICYENSQMTLVIEPFDYTLNYLLYRSDKRIDLYYKISILQQITSACIYLHEKGIIHSNISSHCILIRKNGYRAKLSCFELSTKLNDEKPSEFLLDDCDSMYYLNGTIARSLIRRNQNKNVKEMYLEMSKLNLNHINHEFIDNFHDDELKFLSFNVNYRRKFSQHFYQSPELLKSNGTKYVVPIKPCDVYSLTLVLWEMINNCVPFIIFNYNELEVLYRNEQAALPDINSRENSIFANIYKYGLIVEATKRFMDVQQLYSFLEEVKMKQIETGYIKDHYNDIFEGVKTTPIKSRIINDDTEPKYVSVPMKGLTQTKPRFPETRVNFTDAESLQLSGLTPTPIEKHDNTVEDYPIKLKSKKIPPQKPKRELKRQESNSSILDFNKFLTGGGTKSPIIERTSTVKRKKKNTGSKITTKNTVKDLFRNNVAPSVAASKVMKIDNELTAIADNIKMNKSEIMSEFQDGFSRKNSITRDDILSPIEATTSLKIDLNKIYSQEKLHSNNINVYQTPKVENKIKYNINKTVTNSCPSSYRFSIGKFVLPDTPIARKNKIRRNAWLSEQRINITPEHNTMNCNNFNKITKQKVVNAFNKDDKIWNNFERLSTTTGTSMGSSMSGNKRMNVSVKVLYNKEMNIPETPSTPVPPMSDLSTDIRKGLVSKGLNEILPDFTSKIVKELESTTPKPSPITTNFHEKSPIFHLSSASITSPDILRDAIEKQRQNKSICFENQQWRREKAICDRTMNRDNDITTSINENVITPKRRSVRETIAEFENNCRKISNDDDDCLLNNKNSIIEKIENKKLNGVSKITSSESENSSNEINNELLTPNTCEPQQQPIDSSTPTTPIKYSTNKKSINPRKLSLILPSNNNGQTIIERTIVKECIVSSTSQNTPTRRQQLTTRVIVNLRKTTRPTSDLGFESGSSDDNLARDSPTQLPVVTNEGNNSSNGQSQFQQQQVKRFEIIPRESFLKMDEQLRTMTCCNCGAAGKPIKKIIDSRQTIQLCELLSGSVGGGVGQRQSQSSRPQSIASSQSSRPQSIASSSNRVIFN